MESKVAYHYFMFCKLPIGQLKLFAHFYLVLITSQLKLVLWRRGLGNELI